MVINLLRIDSNIREILVVFLSCSISFNRVLFYITLVYVVVIKFIVAILESWGKGFSRPLEHYLFCLKDLVKL